MKEKFDGFVEQMLASNFFLEEAIELLEKTMIQRMLERTEGNQCAASKRLGIHRNTLLRKMVQYGIGNGRTRARRKPAVAEGRPRKRKTGAA